MTPVQAKVLGFIREQINATGICPTREEIAGVMGVVSKSNTQRVIDALVRDGHLLRGKRGSFRSLRLPGVDLTTVNTAALVAELERRGVILG